MVMVTVIVTALSSARRGNAKNAYGYGDKKEKLQTTSRRSRRRASKDKVRRNRDSQVKTTARKVRDAKANIRSSSRSETKHKNARGGKTDLKMNTRSAVKDSKLNLKTTSRRGIKAAKKDDRLEDSRVNLRTTWRRGMKTGDRDTRRKKENLKTTSRTLKFQGAGSGSVSVLDTNVDLRTVSRRGTRDLKGLKAREMKEKILAASHQGSSNPEYCSCKLAAGTGNRAGVCWYFKKEPYCAHRQCKKSYVCVAPENTAEITCVRKKKISIVQPVAGRSDVCVKKAADGYFYVPYAQ